MAAIRPVVSLVAATLALWSGACLSAPTPADRDGGGDIDGGAFDSGGDDGGAGVDMPFPPPGTAVSITGGWSGDLDGDGGDDLVLCSDTGAPSTTGVYVALGRAGGRLAFYDQFLVTGRFRPMAVLGTDLDGNGGLDLLIYAVDFGTTAGGDEEAQLLAFLAGDDGYGDALTNRINDATSEAWKAPFLSQFPLSLFTARVAPDKPPSIVVAHERGVFELALPSWAPNLFEFTQPRLLFMGNSGVTGGGAVANASTSSVDDVVIWSDFDSSVDWLVNDGSGNWTPAVVNAVAGTAHFATIYDVDGAAPAEIVRLEQTNLAAFPIDTEPGTVGGLLDGQTSIPGVAGATALLVFDADTSDARPDVVLSSPGCTQGGGPACILMVRNIYLDGTSGNLLAGSGVLKRNLPAGFVPGPMFRGDYDGDDDPEIVVFDAEGHHECARIADGLASPCE